MVADAAATAGEELQAAGYELLHSARQEPWGQTVARMLSSEGLIVGISYAPRAARLMHRALTHAADGDDKQTTIQLSDRESRLSNR